MRTLDSVYDEVLGLMFSNNTGSSKVTTEDAPVAEYMFNMHHAFNAGIDDLYTTAIDLREFVHLNDVVFGEIYNVKEEFEDKDRYICATDDVFKIDAKENKYKRTILYDYLLKDVISFEGDGNFAVSVKVKPVLIKDTDREKPLYIEDNILSALVYYMAYRLYLEDDASIATSYLNIYEAKKEALAEVYGERNGSSGQTFESVRGWY